MSADNPFRVLWDMGYRRVVPIVPPGAPVSPHSTLARRPEALGKAPGVRGDDDLWRGFDWLRHDTAEPDLVRWHTMGAGVGIKTGDQGDGTWLIGVDADTLDEQLAAVISGRVRRDFGAVPARVGRPPKVLYVVRVDGPVRYSRVEFGADLERVELLSDGRQFVAAGVHPATRQPYRWVEKLVAFGDLKVWPAEMLT